MVWLISQIEIFSGPSTEVILLIDVSGSMVRLDPRGLAREGSKMISDISDALQVPVKFSIIFYGEKGRIIGEGLNPQDAKKILTDSLMKVKVEKYSDLRFALSLAKGILKRRSEKRQAYVIILTDGRIKEDDIPPGEDIRNYLTTLSSMSADFKENNWNIFVFSSHDAEGAIIELANSSGGAYSKVEDLSEISSKFMNLVEGRVLRFRVDINPKSPVEIPVEEGVAEIGIIVAFDPKEKITLKIYDPDGKEVEGNRKEGKGYTIFTVSKPKPGIWKFDISKGATVLLSMAIPKIIYPSGEHPYTEPINVKLKLDPILPKHPDWKNFSAKIYVEYPTGKQEVYELYDDGKNGDEEPNDGIFGRNIGRLPEGEYTFSAVINHKPTNSEIRVKKTVKLVYIPILAINMDGPWILGRPIKVSLGISNRGGKVFSEEKYSLKVVDPKGNSEEVKLERDEIGGWFGVYAKTFYPGRYKVIGGASIAVKDSNFTRRFPNLTVEDTFTLCISFHKTKVPSFLFFGQMPGKKYTHTLTLLNHCDTTVGIKLAQIRTVYSDTLKDKAITEGQRPQIEKVEPFEILPARGQASAYNLKLNVSIPKDARPGTYNIVLRGTQAPSYRKIEISYPSNVGSWKSFWLTLGGLGALATAGVIAFLQISR